MINNEWSTASKTKKSAVKFYDICLSVFFFRYDFFLAQTKSDYAHNWNSNKKDTSDQELRIVFCKSKRKQ